MAMGLILLMVLALSRSLSSAQPSTCTTTVPTSLQNFVPTVDYNYDPFWIPTNNLRPQIGLRGTNGWSVYSATQVSTYGLWCQVRDIHNAGMGSNIGDWYYPPGATANGFTLAPNSSTSNVPYQSVKCTDQIGLTVVGDITNHQGIVRCITSVPNLSRSENSFGVYSDSVFNAYNGPTVDTSMSLNVVSPRDADQITFMFSFMVSFGPPSRVVCSYNPGNVMVFDLRDYFTDGILFRDVIRSHYVNSSLPDITRVRVQLTQPRVSRTYTCQITVESRVGIASGLYIHDPLGSGSSTATVLVAGTPVGVTTSKIDFNSVLVSWTAPSPSPGYEVFYQTTAASSRVSGGNTSNTELTLTGLTLGETYSFIVVAFGAPGAPVLPSAHSNTANITLNVPQLEDPLTLTPTSSSIVVSWASPQFTPDSYTISHSCQLLGNSSHPPTGSTNIISNGAVTTITIHSIDPNSACTVSLTAVFSGINSNTLTSLTNTTSVINAVTSSSASSITQYTSITKYTSITQPTSSISLPTSSISLLTSSISLPTSIMQTMLATTTTNSPTRPPTTTLAVSDLLIMVGAPVLGSVLLLMIVAIILITGLLVWKRRRSNKGEWASSPVELTPQKDSNSDGMTMTSCGAYDSHIVLRNDKMAVDECAAYGANELPKPEDDENYYEMLPMFDPKQPQQPAGHKPPLPSQPAPQQQPGSEPANYEISMTKSKSGQQQPTINKLSEPPPPSKEQPIYL